MMSIFLFFKQKTAYELRMSDWSSVVCSSDLYQRHNRRFHWQLSTLQIPYRGLCVRFVDKGRKGLQFEGFHQERYHTMLNMKKYIPPRSEVRRVGKECVRTCRSRCVR